MRKGEMGTEYEVPSTEYRVQSTECKVQGAECKAHSADYSCACFVLRTQYPVLRTSCFLLMLSTNHYPLTATL